MPLWIVRVQCYCLLRFTECLVELPIVRAYLGFDLVRQRRWIPHRLSEIVLRLVERPNPRNYIVPVWIHDSGRDGELDEPVAV